MLENMNIFSVGGFAFFLLILSIGYYAVEIIGGKNYWYRRIFENYNNNLFDRVMHYITWGLLINFATAFLFIKTDGMNGIFTILNGAGKIADALNFPGDGISLQLVIFACFYFGLLFGALILINTMVSLFSLIEKLSGRILEKGDTAKQKI